MAVVRSGYESGIAELHIKAETYGEKTVVIQVE